jgi:hypothetical protein
MKNELIISPITTYNEDNQLFETIVGLNDKQMTLLYVVCGKSEQMSRLLAQGLIEKMSKYRSSQNVTVHP